MNVREQENRADEILEQTLKAVVDRRSRRQQMRVAGGGAFLLLVAGLMFVLGRGNEAPRDGDLGEIRLPNISLVSADGFGDPEPLAWGEPRSLLLVMDGNGVEMRSMSDAQIFALARSEGCEFSMSPEALVVVSGEGVETDHFSFSDPF